MKNMHRTFIAIPLPEDTRVALRPFVEQLQNEMPAGAFRFLDADEWHITLSFLGDQDDEGVGRVVSAMPSVVPMLEVPTELQFERIIYGPNPEDPSTIIVMGDEGTSASLGEVRDMLEDGLIAHEASFRPDNRRFVAHITLARRTKESVLLPEVDKPVELIVSPESVDVFESVTEKGSVHHELLASQPVGEVS